MFDEVHMPLTLWRQKTICSTLTSYLTEMRVNRCFVRQVKRHASLPTVRTQIDIIMWRTCEKLEDFAFDTGIISQSNATQQQQRRLADKTAQTFLRDYAVRIAEEV